MTPSIAAIETRRIDQAVAAYRQRLHEISSPLVHSPAQWELCESQARDVLEDCLACVAGEVRPLSDDAEFVSLQFGAHLAGQGMSPLESVRAYQVLFDVALGYLTDASAQLDPVLARSRIGCAARLLHRRISTRIAAAMIGHTAAHPADGDPAEFTTRRELARDIHDQVGSSLSLALAALDLHESDLMEGCASPKRVADVRAALKDTVRFTRDIVRGLRTSHGEGSLRERILGYTESIGGGNRPAVKVTETGDGSGVGDTTKDEAYLIIREGLRNALAHSAARRILVSVLFSAIALECSIVDDGIGFDPQAHRASGSGMAVMYERAAHLGGYLDVSSRPGLGTRITLSIPLDTGETPRPSALR